MLTDFEERFSEIQRIFRKFHETFLQDTTKGRHNMAAVPEVKVKILYIYDALRTFLNSTLLDGATCESTIKDVHVIAGFLEDANLTSQVQTLLTDLCPLMFPWDVNMNAKVGGLFDQFAAMPYSPVRIDAAPVPDPLTQ